MACSGTAFTSQKTILNFTLNLHVYHKRKMHVILQGWPTIPASGATLPAETTGKNHVLFVCSETDLNF
jgi:hypothetical protein